MTSPEVPDEPAAPLGDSGSVSAESVNDGVDQSWWGTPVRPFDWIAPALAPGAVAIAATALITPWTSGPDTITIVGNLLAPTVAVAGSIIVGVYGYRAYSRLTLHDTNRYLTAVLIVSLSVILAVVVGSVLAARVISLVGILLWQFLLMWAARVPPGASAYPQVPRLTYRLSVVQAILLSALAFTIGATGLIDNDLPNRYATAFIGDAIFILLFAVIAGFYACRQLRLVSHLPSNIRV